MARNVKPVNLALQGGGAHGAFTWGVLDYLLEHGGLSFEAISGTSAGAMNAAVLSEGLARGGADTAREALTDFWQSVSRAAAFSPVKRSPWAALMGDWSLDTSPGFLMMDMISRLASPYDLNPLNINPLRDVLEAQVDFDRLRACTVTKLFLSATNVHTGRVRVFRTPEITPDVVMASACLPHMFQAVEIDGIPYWDGGFAANPAIFPFYDSCRAPDVLLIQINPMVRETTPRSARDILNRMNEITFNQSLMKELRAINFVSRLIDDGRLDPERYKQVLLHTIADEEDMAALSASSKMNAEWDFLVHLRDLGRGRAKAWMAGCYEKVGRESSVDVRALFDGEAH